MKTLAKYFDALLMLATALVCFHEAYLAASVANDDWYAFTLLFGVVAIACAMIAARTAHRSYP